MRKSWTFTFLVVAVLVISCVVVYRYYDYMILTNYQLTAQTICNPSTEKCFVANCDIATDPTCDSTPYKKVAIKASEAPACLAEHSCTDFVCNEANMPSCVITYCAEDTLEEGEVCLAEELHINTP